MNFVFSMTSIERKIDQHIDMNNSVILAHVFARAVFCIGVDSEDTYPYPTTQ